MYILKEGFNINKIEKLIFYYLGPNNCAQCVQFDLI